MKINELVDIPRLAKRLQEGGKSSFDHWKDTAHEVCPDRYKEIGIVYNCYTDLHSDELLIFRFESFIEDMLTALPTEEDRKRFLWIEALHEKKFLK